MIAAMARLTWHGHACFTLVTDEGSAIMFDPFLTDNPVADIGADQVRQLDYILCSHGHFDHFGDAIARTFEPGPISAAETHDRARGVRDAHPRVVPRLLAGCDRPFRPADEFRERACPFRLGPVRKRRNRAEAARYDGRGRLVDQPSPLVDVAEHVELGTEHCLKQGPVFGVGPELERGACEVTLYRIRDSGRDEQSVGIDGARRVVGDRADLGDAAVAHADVRRARGRAGAVDDRAALDQEIKRRCHRGRAR